MAWEFLLAVMYLLGVLTMFVMTLTSSQKSDAKDEEIEHQVKPDTIDYEKAA